MKPVTVNGIEYTKDSIKELLLTNDQAVARAVFRIYQYQTDYEKTVEGTVMNNNVGFNGSDAKIMTSMAKFYIKAGKLTEKQIKYIRPRVIKYAGQILKIMANAQ